jgi:lipopolysaccharide heptosyltransferase II
VLWWIASISGKDGRAGRRATVAQPGHEDEYDCRDLAPVFDHLDGIYDSRERLAVGLADTALSVASLPLGLLRRRPRGEPQRILLLRLERIGDLLMSLGAIQAVRTLAPHAVIDLVVGSWNEPVARTIPGIDRLEVLDAPWLARGESGSPLARIAARALCWRRQHYDLAINFEGDVRSHALMAASLAPRTVGFAMAGGGPVLTDVVAHDPRRHTALAGLALVERAFGLREGSLPGPLDPAGASLWRLALPAAAADAAARALLAAGVEADAAPLVAVHVAGGRAIKQWPVARFAEVARALARSHGARILLTGTEADRPLVEEARAALAGVPGVHALSGALDLLALAGVLERCALVVTGDTGPMHLAASVGAPIVAIFGPSSPDRYGPLAAHAQVVRIDLPCSPCNRVRKPPERCVGHTPDCLEGIDVARVLHAATTALGQARFATRRP